MKQPSKRSTAALLRKFAVACAGLLAALALLQPGFANASAMVDTIVVKYRDDALPAGATRLPDGDRALLGHMRKANFVEIGRNRDGAFRIAVDPPLSIDEARAAMNRMRLNPAVLYVGVAERNVMSKSTAAALASAGNQRPVRALIVKYRDPQLVANALADRPLPTAQLQRVADVARMPVATMRTMGEGQYLVQLFQSMSASAAFYIARAARERRGGRVRRVPIFGNLRRSCRTTPATRSTRIRPASTRNLPTTCTVASDAWRHRSRRRQPAARVGPHHGLRRTSPSA